MYKYNRAKGSNSVDGRSRNSLLFISWMDNLRKSRKLTLDDTAEKLGISRKALCEWRSDPSKMSKCQLAGIAYLLDYDCGDFDELCKEFKVKYRSRLKSKV